MTEMGVDVDFDKGRPDRRRQQQVVPEGLLDFEVHLVVDIEQNTFEWFMGLEHRMIGDMPDRRYVLVVARPR